MTTSLLTSKRQATFPKETCESLGLKPGDVIELEARDEGGTKVWVLRPPTARHRSWVGCLGSHARNVTDRLRSPRSGRASRPAEGRDMTAGLDTSIVLRLLVGQPADQPAERWRFWTHCPAGATAP